MDVTKRMWKENEKKYTLTPPLPLGRGKALELCGGEGVKENRFIFSLFHFSFLLYPTVTFRRRKRRLEMRLTYVMLRDVPPKPSARQ
jgi:hypothetical protein